MEISVSLEGAEGLKEKIFFLDQLEAYLKSPDQAFTNVTALDNESVSRIVKAIVTPGLVKDFSELEERDFDESDFPDVATAAERSFSCLKHLLSIVNVKIDCLKSHELFSIPILKLCATHSKEFMWSSAKAVSLSQEVLDQLLKITNCSGLEDLLCTKRLDHRSDILKAILLSMRSSLSKGTWTHNPSICHIFQWLLLSVKHPYLSDHLPYVLPPSLMFIDHHTNEKKILGIECLHHIIDNIPATELKLYGRADVVYDVLYRLVYLNEPDIIDVLYPCLLEFLSGQERDPHNADIPRKWGRYDDIFHQLMLNIQLEERVILRRAYSRHISIFIDKMGITVVRHLKSIAPLLVKYLTVYDGPEEESRINALLALRSLIKVAWPRIDHYMEEFLKRLVFLIYDTENGSGTNNDKVKHNILQLSKECLLLLKIACPDKFLKLMAGIADLQDIPGVDILKTVFNLED